MSIYTSTRQLFLCFFYRDFKSSLLMLIFFFFNCVQLWFLACPTFHLLAFFNIVQTHPACLLLHESERKKKVVRLIIKATFFTLVAWLLREFAQNIRIKKWDYAVNIFHIDLVGHAPSVHHRFPLSHLYCPLFIVYRVAFISTQGDRPCAN